jgi:hypothetical protein
MAENRSIPPSRTPLVNDDGTLNSVWYSYFVNLGKKTDAAGAGEVVAGDGLEGGGTVSGGVTLAIGDGAVTNQMLRNGAACSVIGRGGNTQGDVADIQATADGRVLARRGGQLAFYNAIELTTITVGNLRVTPAATVSVATLSTHKVPIRCNGVDYFILLTT